MAAQEGKGGGVAAKGRVVVWQPKKGRVVVAAQEGKGGQVPWDQWNDAWTSSDWDTWSTWSYSQYDWQEPPQTQWDWKDHEVWENLVSSIHVFDMFVLGLDSLLIFWKKKVWGWIAFLLFNIGLDSLLFFSLEKV